MNKPKIIFEVLTILIFIGVLLRFYNLRNNIQFDFDQENSLAFPAKSILIDKHPTLIGPKTGIGDLYIEPLYYYLVALFYGLFHLDPIAGVLLADTLSLFTIFFGFILVKKLFNIACAYYFALVWGCSSFILFIDRTPWNPNLLPISSLLVFSGLWMLLYLNKLSGWLTISLGLILGLNSHFSVIFLIIIVFIVTLLNRKIVNKFSILSFLMIILSLSPLIIFNFRHSLLLQQNLIKFVTMSTPGIMPAFNKIIPLTLYLLETIGRVILSDIPSWKTQIAGIFYIIALIYYSSDSQISKFNKVFTIYLAVYLLGFTIYQGSIPNYYFLGIIPPASIGYALLISRIFQKIPLFLVLVILIYSANLIRSYTEVSKNNPASLANKQKIVATIKENAHDQPVSVIYDMDIGWSYGYNYLFYYYKVNKVDSPNALLQYRISYPVRRFPGKPDYIYGDIALIKEAK